MEEEECVLLASRRSLPELVRLTFLDVQMSQALELNEEAGFLLTGSEAQRQETLAAHPELIESGLRVLNRELLVESGGIDLDVQDAVPQWGRYVVSVQRVIGRGVIRGILAAPSITGPARRELEGRGLEFGAVGALPLLEKTTTQPSLF